MEVDRAPMLDGRRSVGNEVVDDQPHRAVTAERLAVGPDSLLWRYAGDTRIALLGGTIGLLQLMHPAIGAGVLEHSNFFEDPTDRVFRSLPRILGAVYDADPDATGDEVRQVHHTIKGTTPGGDRYHALDPATFWWAHATFQFMAEQVADRFDRHRLTPAEREQLYIEGVEWYRRYGVSDRAVPADRAAFQAEWDHVCAEVLEMNDAVRFVVRLLDQKLVPKWDDRADLPRRLRPIANLPTNRWVAARGARLVAIGGLPEVVRRRFGIRWTRRDAIELAALERWISSTWWLLPASVRWQPRALEGWQRATGRVP
jgi:uncharacterized protein (DUF2236 family)